ncbi:hypothetical protein ABGT24_11795 [Peribacillus frigoritolerans]|uniref:hypothetical protein n=1 Tax=Peribacillus frigoritolerans TaxID=450367 RepID=UPI00345CDCC6
MQMALLVSAFATGLIMLPGSLLNCVFAPIGRLFDKYGPRAVITPERFWSSLAMGYMQCMERTQSYGSWLLRIS